MDLIDELVKKVNAAYKSKRDFDPTIIEEMGIIRRYIEESDRLEHVKLRELYDLFARSEFPGYSPDRLIDLLNYEEYL